MQIKMLESRSGSPDGMATVFYQKGLEYRLPDDLARVFLEEKWAVATRPPASGKKDLGAAPENKSAPARPNKLARKPAGRKPGK